MKSIAVVATSFAIFLCHFAHASARHDGYIIKLRKASDQNQMEILSELGIKIDAKIPQLNLIKTSVNPFKLQMTAADADQLSKMIEYVEPNYFAHKTDIQKKEEDTLINYKMINAPAAWEITKGSKNIIVAISDTGIWQHPDLKGNLWINKGEQGLDANGKDKSKNKIDDDGNGFIDDTSGWNFATNSKYWQDDMYHGTHVAGTIGAVGGNNMGITGVAWKVSLMSVKFLNKDGSGTYLGGIGSIVYAVDNGARIINCSWGGDEYSEALKESIEYAKSKNVLVVAAAGNDAVDADKYPLYPAAYNSENIISVASTFDMKKGELSFFSNWGVNSVDIAAPGERIYSTFNPTYSQINHNFYEYLMGTSMAAPHVSGVAALVLSLNPQLKWNEVKDLILSHGTPLPKLNGKIKTGAMLNALAVVRAAPSMR